MKLFECQNCGQLLYFENTQCQRCGMALGYMSDLALISALEPNGDGTYHPLADRGRTVKYCANQQHAVCNWLLNTTDNDPLCRACDLNRTIPDLTVPDNMQRWQRIESAKHRLIYSLLRLGLPTESKLKVENGFAFDFLAPPTGGGAQSKILTGHDHGEITLNVIEADDVKRAQIRENMGEPYRTLLGHFRHEIAHYYFERLVLDNPDLLTMFRNVFGDERADYGEALKVHYANGAPADWQLHHISSYASSHPHEDWAETFAHYLHMVDTLETAYSFGIRIRPRAGQDDNLTATISFDPYNQSSFDPIIDAWLPMTFAVNSINRSMGIDDLYPFVISPEVIEKLKAVHQVIQSSRSNAPSFGKRVLQLVTGSLAS